MSPTMSRSALFTRQLLALAMTSIFVTGSALAQTPAPRPSAATPASPPAKLGGAKAAGAAITYKQKTTYDFDDEEVDGGTVRPDGDMITTVTKASHQSLLPVRTTFKPEMLKSVEFM